MSYAKPPREIVSNLYAMWSPSQTQRQRGSIEYFSVISINASSGALPSQHTHLRSCWINNTLEMGEMIHHNDARTLYFSRPAKTASLMISANLFLFFNRSDSEIHSPSTQLMSFLAHLRYIKKYRWGLFRIYGLSLTGMILLRQMEETLILWYPWSKDEAVPVLLANRRLLSPEVGF